MHFVQHLCLATRLACSLTQPQINHRLLYQILQFAIYWSLLETKLGGKLLLFRYLFRSDRPVSDIPPWWCNRNCVQVWFERSSLWKLSPASPGSQHGIRLNIEQYLKPAVVLGCGGKHFTLFPALQCCILVWKSNFCCWSITHSRLLWGFTYCSWVLFLNVT